MFSLVKKIVLLIISTPLTWGYCLLLKNQECKLRKVIVDNDYMTFPYKIGIDRCVGSCNSENIILIIKFVYQILLKILV